jgi:hypothetical protein
MRALQLSELKSVSGGFSMTDTIHGPDNGRTDGFGQPSYGGISMDGGDGPSTSTGDTSGGGGSGSNVTAKVGDGTVTLKCCTIPLGPASIEIDVIEVKVNVTSTNPYTNTSPSMGYNRL